MTTVSKLERLTASLNQDNEIGNVTRPPRLQSIHDYPTWAMRYEAFLLYNNPDLWRSITDGPHTANADEVSLQAIEVDRKKGENDTKSRAMLTMALSQEILINFKDHKSAKSLWDALKARYEGNSDMKQARKAHAMQGFTDFRPQSEESVHSIVERFSVLVYALKCAEVNYSDGELNRKLLNSMPYDWNINAMMIRRMEDLDKTSHEEIIQKILSVEIEVQQAEARRTGKPYTTPMNAFVANSSSSGSVNNSSPEQELLDWISTPSSKSSSTEKSHQGMYSEGKVKGSSSSSKEEIKGTEEYMGLFNTFIQCYNAFIAGKITPGKLMFDDLTQVNPDDVEEIDIKWNMALTVYRAKQYQKRTGKQIRVDGELGFDKSKSRCYNCHELGHFARECKAPKDSSNGKGKDKVSGAGGEKALIADSSWDRQAEVLGLKLKNHAYMAEITDKQAAKSSSSTIEIVEEVELV